MDPVNPSRDPLEEVKEHGMPVDPELRIVQCCYCGNRVAGYNLLHQHLAGVGVRVIKCETVPVNVKEFFKKSSSSSKSGKRNRASNGTAKLRNCKLRKCMSSNNDGVYMSKNGSSRKGGQDSATLMAKKRIARFFFENVVDYSAITSESFKVMMGISLKSGEVNVIPSIHELKGWIFDDELTDIQKYVNEVRLSWPNTGCSVMFDAWEDKLGRSLVNVIVDCPMGPVYLRTADISPSKKGENALQELLEDVLEDVGVQNVVQIIAHNYSDKMDAIGEQMVEKYRSLFWTVSAGYCISLILENFAKIKSIKVTLDKAKTITKFIYNHAGLLQLLRRHISCHDLIVPSKIKVVEYFLTLENIVLEKRKLERMFTSSEWLNSSWASTFQGKEVASLICDKSFWKDVVVAVKVSIPLVGAISLIYGSNEPNIGFIYETMDQVKETISLELGGKETTYIQFWKIIDEIWNKILHSPLHSASYFLNPRFQYSDDFYSDSEVAGDLLVTVVKLAQDQHVQDSISQQLRVYKDIAGDFKLGTESNNLETFSPATWWSKFGGQCPDLQKLAVKVLSQTCNGADFYDLRRDLAENLISTGRNLIEQQRLQDLVYVHYNMKLKQSKKEATFSIKSDEIDPTNDWIVDHHYVTELYELESTTDH